MRVPIFKSYSRCLCSTIIKNYLRPFQELNYSIKIKRNMCSNIGDQQMAQIIKTLAPPLTRAKHKGQDGRIAVFGGSLEYTGAPYFSAIAALKVGADLAHVFCVREAAPVIKSYSPELIVHPLLDGPVSHIEPWLDRFHVVIIGPGLGREPSTFQVIEEVVQICRRLNKPLVIDADGLFFVAQKHELLKDYPNTVILTPNVMEFSRLVNIDSSGSKQERAKRILDLSPKIVIVCKGPEDEIFDNHNCAAVSGGGSGRRCGGQGDILGGSLATFLAWTLSNPEFDSLPFQKSIAAAYAACRFVRTCNSEAFAKKARSMTASDMIEEIHTVFQRDFERANQ